MIKVEDNHIYMTRGDSFSRKIDIMQKDSECGELYPYEMQPGDQVIFALKTDEYIGIRYTDFKEAEPLLRKEVSPETLMLELEPEDTRDLKFGKYVYDVHLVKEDGWVDTFIQDEEFDLLKEAHGWGT